MTLPDDLQKQIDAATAKLARFRATLRVHLLTEGTAVLLSAVVVLTLLSLIVDRWLGLGLGLRRTLLVAAVLGLVAVARVYLWQVITAPLDFVHLAALLDRKRPGIAQRVATLLQMPKELGAPNSSDELAILAIRRSAAELSKIDLGQHIEHVRFRKCLAICLAMIAVPVLWVTLSPDTARLWSARWLAGSNEEWPRDTYLQVAGLEDGQLLVPRGEPYTLQASAQDGSVVPELIRMRIEREGRKTEAAAMTRFADNDFRYDFPPVQTTLSVRLRGGDDRFGPFTIKPVERPRVIAIEVTSKHPRDKEPTVQSFSGHADELRFLPETEVKLRLTASAPIKTAALRFGDTAMPLNQQGDRELVTEWTLKHAVDLELRMTAVEGEMTSRPLLLSVGIVIDRPPQMSIRYSGVRQRITPAATVPVTVMARDDFGLALLEIERRIEPLKGDSREAPPVVLFGPERPSEAKDLRPATQLEVAQLSLEPGDMLIVQARAEDDRYLGPQEGQSRQLAFSIVSADELFREILMRQQTKRAEFRKARDEAKALADVLATVDGKLPADVLRRQRVLQRQVSRVHQSVSDMVTEMRLNKVGSVETHDLVERQVIEPLATLINVRMNEQLEAMDNVHSTFSADALIDVADRQVQIVQVMKEILSHMSQWESFVDVLNQLNEVIRLQKNTLKETDKLIKDSTESLFDD